MKIFGITGWKNSGKTTLVAKIIEYCKSKGITVSTIKHAHHNFDIDKPGKDSHVHREAGASEVLISSANRWALLHELRDEEEASLKFLISKLTPVDLVLVEGFKNEDHPKIEVYREEIGNEPIYKNNNSIVAVATDSDLKAEGKVTLNLNNISEIGDFIITHLNIESEQKSGLEYQ